MPDKPRDYSLLWFYVVMLGISTLLTQFDGCITDHKVADLQRRIAVLEQNR